MGMFTVIPQDTFEGLQLDAGVILTLFDPANPEVVDSAIVCATTGGINVSCVPKFSDMGEDVDNCPTNMKELKHLDGWDTKMGFTSISTSPKSIRLALGAADEDAETGAITPRKDLKQTDFSHIWWVGDRADGGLVAVQLKNALSTDGFTLQTTKAGKGQVSVGLMGHVALANQNEMPMVIYSLDPDEVTYTITQTLSHVTSSLSDTTIEENESLEATLTAETGYVIGTVSVTMGGVNITSTAYNSSTRKVTIGAVTGNVVITATGTGTEGV